MPTRARTSYQGHLLSKAGDRQLDFPPPVTHQSGLFPALPRGSPLDRDISPPRQRAWHGATHGTVVYPPTETVVEKAVVPISLMHPTTPVQEATNDHIKDRLEFIEAQMDMLRNTTQEESFVSYKGRYVDPEPAGNSQELDALRKQLEAKQRKIDELEKLLEEAKGRLSGASVNDDLLADLKAKLAEERKNLNDLRGRHKEMLSSALDDINSANSKLADQEDKIDGYKTQLAAEQQRADLLEREMDALRARAGHEGSLAGELSKANDDLRKAKKRIFELEDALDKAEHALSDMGRGRKRSEMYLETAERLEVELARVKQDATAKDDEIRKLRSELQNAIRAEGDAANEIDLMKEKMKNDLINATRKADQLAEERTRLLEEELRRLKAEGQRQENRRLEGEEEKRRGAEEELRRLRGDLARSESRRLETEEEKKQALQKLEELEGSASKMKRTFDRLKEMEALYDDAMGKVHELEKTNRSLYDQLETSKYECQREREQGANWKAEVEKLRAEAAKLKAENDAAKLEADRMKSDNNRLHSNAEKLRDENKELLDEVQKMRSYIDRAKADSEKLRSESDRLRLEAESGKNELERLRSDLVKVRSEAEALRLENVGVKSDNVNIKSECEKLRSENDRLKLEIENCRNELERVRNDFKQARGEAEDMRLENVNAKADASKYKHEADILKGDLERLQQQLRSAANIPGQPQAAAPTSPAHITSQRVIVPPAQSQPQMHTMMISGEEEIMRIGSELRRALRARDDALSEMDSLHKQLAKSKRQTELAQQELETCEAKSVATKRQNEDLKTELEATIIQLTRARTTAQEALAEADASGRMLNEARKIADEAREKLQQETQRFQHESELAERSWNEAMAAADEERAELERRLQVEEERCNAATQRMEEFQRQAGDLSRQLDAMQEVLKTESQLAEQRLQGQKRQLEDQHSQQQRKMEEQHAKDLDRKLQAHKAELQEVQNRHSAAVQEANNRHSAAMQEEKNRYNSVVQELNDLKDMLDKAVEDRNEVQATLEQQLEEAFQNLRESTDEIKQLKDKVSCLTTEQNNVADELVATQLALAKIQDHATSKENECMTLRAQLEREEERVRMELSVMDQEMLKLRAESDAQTLAERGQAEALTEVHKCYEEASVEAKQLRSMLQAANAENKEAGQVIRELEDKLGSVCQQLEGVMKNKEEVTERLVASENMASDLQKELVHAVEKYEEKKREVQTVTYDLEVRSGELEGLSVKYLSIKSEADEAKQSNHTLASEVQRLTNDVDSLKQNLMQASLDVDDAKYSRNSDRNEAGRLRQLEERARLELEEANERLTEALAQETALRKELRGMQDKLDRNEMAYSSLETKLNHDLMLHQQMTKDNDGVTASLNEVVHKLRVEIDRSNAELESLTVREETATRRLQDAHRLHESKENALQEDILSERQARAELEEQLANARKQYRQARRDATLSSEEADKEREVSEEHNQQRLKKYKQELEEAMHEKDRLLDASGLLNADLHKYFINEEATFRHLYSTKEELNRMDILLAFERLTSDGALAHHLRIATGNERDLKHALEMRAAEILQKNEELSLIYNQLEETKQEARQTKHSNEVFAQQVRLLQADQGEVDQLVKKYEDKVTECQVLKEELHTSNTTAQEMASELNLTVQKFELRERELLGDLDATNNHSMQEIDGLKKELMKTSGNLEATNTHNIQEIESLKNELRRVQMEWSHTNSTLDSERGVVQSLREELEVCKREMHSTKERFTAEMKNFENVSQYSITEERKRCDVLKEDLAALQETHQKMTLRCNMLMALPEAINSDRPTEGIGRLTWRLNMEADPLLSTMLTKACEHMTRLYQLDDGARSLHAGFDFICATREPLIRELGACKKAVFETFQEASRLMEELLRSGSENKGSRESCGRVCASLGGMRSQVVWLVSNCLSSEERTRAGILHDEDISGTIKHLRRTTLPLSDMPATPEARPHASSQPLNSAIKKQSAYCPVSPDPRIALVSPVPSRTSDCDLASCYGSDDGLDPRTPRSLPKTTPKKARVVAPEDHTISPRR